MKKSFYDQIARDYHQRKAKPWRDFEKYFNHLKEAGYVFKGFVLDMGCGNGRHFELLSNSFNKLIGIDNSIELLKLSKDQLNRTTANEKKQLFVEIILADMNFLPIRPKLIHFIFAIATFHHIKGKDLRKRLTLESCAILKTSGLLIFTVWRRWQKKFKKFFVYDWIKRKANPYYKKQQKQLNLKDFGDKFVPWTVSREGKSYNRFYHFFSKREIKKLLGGFKIKELKKMRGPFKKDNFFIFAQKKKLMT